MKYQKDSLKLTILNTVTINKEKQQRKNKIEIFFSLLIFDVKKEKNKRSKEIPQRMYPVNWLSSSLNPVPTPVAKYSADK